MDSTPPRFLRITGFGFDFSISLLRCSSHSCALHQVMLQCRHIAVPKQKQNHFTSIGLELKLFSLSLSLSLSVSGDVVMWAISTRYAVFYSMVHYDRHAWTRVTLLVTLYYKLALSFMAVFLHEATATLQLTCLCCTTSCPGTSLSQT